MLFPRTKFIWEFSFKSWTQIKRNVISVLHRILICIFLILFSLKISKFAKYFFQFPPNLMLKKIKVKAILIFCRFLWDFSQWVLFRLRVRKNVFHNSVLNFRTTANHYIPLHSIIFESFANILLKKNLFSCILKEFKIFFVENKDNNCEKVT